MAGTPIPNRGDTMTYLKIQAIANATRGLANAGYVDFRATPHGKGVKRRAVATVAVLACLAATVGAPAAVAQSQRFPDVPPDHHAFEAVEWAAEVGVTTGYTDGTFKPQRPLVKQHAVVFMQRYYDEILQAEESEDFTRGDMMVLLKAIDDGTIDSAESGAVDTSDGQSAAPTLVVDPVTVPEGLATFTLEGSGFDPSLRTWTLLCPLDTSLSEDTPQGRVADAMASVTAADCALDTAQAVTFDDEGSFSVRRDAIVMANFMWVASDADQTQVAAAAVFMQALEPDPVARPSGFVSISVSANHACAIGTNDTITCWGQNNHGQADAPTGTYRAISVGANHACAIGTDDTITCWGIVPPPLGVQIVN